MDINSSDFEDQAAQFGAQLDGIWDQVTRSQQLMEKIYKEAQAYQKAEEYEKAYMLFGLLATQEYADSQDKAYECAMYVSN